MTYRKNKYGNKKVTYNGEIFDSQHELDRYLELRLLERAGKIEKLDRQVKYLLIPTQRDENNKVIERPCAYIADFVYLKDGQIVVEDAKGHKTKEYIIKRKLMLQNYGLRVVEV